MSTWIQSLRNRSVSQIDTELLSKIPKVIWIKKIIKDKYDWLKGRYPHFFIRKKFFLNAFTSLGYFSHYNLLVLILAKCLYRFQHFYYMCVLNSDLLGVVGLGGRIVISWVRFKFQWTKSHRLKQVPSKICTSVRILYSSPFFVSQSRAHSSYLVVTTRSSIFLFRDFSDFRLVVTRTQCVDRRPN